MTNDNSRAHQGAQPRRYLAAAFGLALVGTGAAHAASIKVLHRFAYTNGSSSHFALGKSPQSELLQASDGNLYGTTTYGGNGKCPGNEQGVYAGCGVIFRMTPQGAVTTLYSFPFDTATNTAPKGAFPTAGLIQAPDGYLYGVAQDGGLGGCNGAYGCGTAFRISLDGQFKLLHQFCGSSACTGISEGGRPFAHLVLAANGRFYGTAAQGGTGNSGTLFSMTAAGAVTTLHVFDYGIGDGYNPVAPLLPAPDGVTFYGTTTFGGANGGGGGGGTVFKLRGTTVTIIHSFDNLEDSDPGTAIEPDAAVIFGADGKLYGTTSSGSQGGTLFSLATDGSGFDLDYIFKGGQGFGGTEPVTALVLASNGLMYGTTLQGSTMNNNSTDGALFSFNPVTGKLKALKSFTTTTGAQPRGALIEGSDGYLYGTTSLYGNTAYDAGSAFRFGPALAP